MILCHCFERSLLFSHFVFSSQHQYAQRPGPSLKGPRAYSAVPPNVYPGGAAPVFYQTPNMPQQFMYNPQQMRQGAGRAWTGAPPSAAQYAAMGQYVVPGGQVPGAAGRGN